MDRKAWTVPSLTEMSTVTDARSGSDTFMNESSLAFYSPSGGV